MGEGLVASCGSLSARSWRPRPTPRSERGTTRRPRRCDDRATVERRRSPRGERSGAASDPQSRSLSNGDDRGDRTRQHQRQSVGPGRGAECGEQSGGDPAPRHQAPQASHREHQEQRLGVGERQHEAARKHRSKDHCFRRDLLAVQLPCQHAEQKYRDSTEHEVAEQRGECVAARQDLVDGADQQWVRREERGAGVGDEVGDVLLERGADTRRARASCTRGRPMTTARRLIGPRAEVGTGLPAMCGSANGTPATPLVWLMSTCSSAATIAAPATTHSREKMYTNPTLRRMRYQVAGVSSTGASCGPRGLCHVVA